MLYKLLLKSLSVKVTLEYVISSRGLQKLSKECQPMAPNLFFQLISCYRYIWWKFQIDRWNQLNCHEIQSLCGAIPYPLASLLLGSYITTWEWQFAPHSYGKKWDSLCRLLMKKFLVKISQNLPPDFGIAHNQGYTLVRMLYLALVCEDTMF